MVDGVTQSVSLKVPENPSGPLVDKFMVLPCVACGVASVKLLTGVDRWNSLDDPWVFGPCHCEVWEWLRHCPSCETSDLGLTASVPLILWWEFSFYLGFRARNRRLVEMFLVYQLCFSPDQIMISHMNRWLSCRIMWYIWPHLIINIHLKARSILHEIWSSSSSLMVARLHCESHGSQAADILNGSSTASIR